MRSRAVVSVLGIGNVIHEVSEVVMYPERDPEGGIFYKISGRHTTGKGTYTPTLALEKDRDTAKEYFDKIQFMLDLKQTEDLCERYVQKN